MFIGLKSFNNISGMIINSKNNDCDHKDLLKSLSLTTGDVVDPDVGRMQMKQMWVDIFGDSRDYVDLLFDSYGSDMLTSSFWRSDRMVSMGIGLPMEFVNREGNKIKAVYLCGLATDPDFRCHGLMSLLIDDLCFKARKAGFALAFLIPANDALRLYYRRRGFSEGIRRVVRRYACGHDFYHEFALSLTESEEVKKMELLKKFLDIKIVEMRQFDQNSIPEITDFIASLKPEIGAVLSRTARDVATVIRENILSGGYVVIARDGDGCGDISAMATVEFTEEGNVKIPYIWSINKIGRMALLNAISMQNAEKSLLVYESIEQSMDDIPAVWVPEIVTDSRECPGIDAAGAGAMPERSVMNAENYAMVKFLSVSEILKFTVDESKNLKYSILVKEINNDGLTLVQLQNIVMESGEGKAAEILGLPHMVLQASHLYD